MHNPENLPTIRNPSCSPLYLMNFCLFGPADVEVFCSYKHFIENTIVELGDDWRIESGLLSQ